MNINMSKEKINKLIDDMLQQRHHFGIDSFCMGDDDLKATCFSFLVSKCILRLSITMNNNNVYVFSKPGREIMEDDSKRLAFVEEFLKFYGNSE